MEIQEGTKNMRIPYILRTITNFLVFFYFDFFRASIEHALSVINLFKQYPSDIRSNFFLKKNFKEVEIREDTKNMRIPHTF